LVSGRQCWTRSKEGRIHITDGLSPGHDLTGRECKYRVRLVERDKPLDVARVGAFHDESSEIFGLDGRCVTFVVHGYSSPEPRRHGQSAGGVTSTVPGASV